MLRMYVYKDEIIWQRMCIDCSLIAQGKSESLYNPFDIEKTIEKIMLHFSLLALPLSDFT